jgi:hypothetical protein
MSTASLALILALGAHDAAASQDWPVGAERAILDLQVHFEPLRSLGAGPCLAAEGCFKVSDSVVSNYGTTGGWLYLNGELVSGVPHAFEGRDTFTYYPISWSESSTAQAYMTDAFRDALAIQIVTHATPTFRIPGHPNTSQSLPYTTSSYYTRADVPQHPVDAPQVPGNARSWLIRPGLQPDWIDSQVTMEITVTPDAAFIDPGWAGQSYTYAPTTGVDPLGVDVPLVLHQVADPFGQWTPFFVPTAIVGRPPGDLSWSRLTQTSGQAASVAVFETETNRRTVESSWGFGPVGQTEPTVTTTRDTGQGVTQQVSQSLALSVQTQNPYGPGEGDVMVGMLQPTVRLSKAPADLDFELLAGGSPVLFTMRELLHPTTTQSVTVQNLTADERQAVLDLNPLVADPHARLKEPRYVLVHQFQDQVGASVGGQASLYSVTRAQVEAAVGRSTTTTTSDSFALPMGAIAKAVGSPIPIPDPTSRVQETKTSSARYSSEASLTGSGGTLIEFVIADSDPQKRLCTEVYYDTYFRSFAFRDCLTPGARSWVDGVHETYELAQALPEGLELVRIEDDHGEAYGLVGSLGKGNEAAEAASSTVRFVADEEGVDFEVALVPGTANLLAVGVAPGSYTVTHGGEKYRVKLADVGPIELQHLGSDALDCTSKEVGTDECGKRILFVDRCSQSVQWVETYSSTCVEVPDYERSCEIDGASGSCTYSDSFGFDEGYSW